MTRKEFIEKSMVLGIGLPFLSSTLMQSCGMKRPFYPKVQSNFAGKVMIVGAGAAGMAAGYFLKSHGIDFEILEAAPHFGGRLKKVADFADFPIDLGAEWIHVHPDVLKDIANKPRIDDRFETMDYNPQIIKTWNHGKLKSQNFLKH